MNTPNDIPQVISSLKHIHGEAKIAAMVREQLLKDFQTAGMELSLPGSDYQSWLGEIAEAMAGATAGNLSALLYSVDIPERLASGFRDRNEFASVILYREFIKIYFRLNYTI